MEKLDGGGGGGERGVVIHYDNCMIIVKGQSQVHLTLK